MDRLEYTELTAVIITHFCFIIDLIIRQTCTQMLPEPLREKCSSHPAHDTRYIEVSLFAADRMARRFPSRRLHRNKRLQQTRRSSRHRSRKQRGGQLSPPHPTLSVVYNPNLQVAGQLLTQQQTAAAPKLTFSSLDPSKTYALLLHDPDAVQPSYIHSLITDIHAGNEKGTTAVPYQGPAPPPGSAPVHRYIFTLFVQSPGFVAPTERSGFDASILPPAVATQQFTVKSPPLK